MNEEVKLALDALYLRLESLLTSGSMQAAKLVMAKIDALEYTARYHDMPLSEPSAASAEFYRLVSLLSTGGYTLKLDYFPDCPEPRRFRAAAVDHGGSVVHYSGPSRLSAVRTLCVELLIHVGE